MYTSAKATIWERTKMRRRVCVDGVNSASTLGDGSGSLKCE